MPESILTKNIEAIVGERPKLSKAIENYRKLHKEPELTIEYKMVDVGDREILCADKDGVLYQLESIYSNESILDAWYKKYESTFKDQTYIILGLGNGMYVRKLINSIPKDVTYNILVVEPFLEGLIKLFEVIDYSKLFSNENVKLFVYDFEEKTLEKVIYSQVDYANLKGVSVVEYPNYSTLYSSMFKEFYSEIRTGMLRVSADRGVLEYFGGRFYLNTMQNMSVFVDSYSFDSLKDNLPEGLTAIIVASGPSLSKNINELRKAKGRALIVSVDSALMVLLKEGIIPDIYVSVDATKAEANYADERVSDIAVIGDLTLPPYTFKENQIKYITFANNEHIIKYLYNVNSEMNLWDMREGGSVATGAFFILCSLGIKKFILCGQDLAYTDNKAHADNVAFDDDAEMKAETLYVKDIFGNTVRSSRLFLLYKSSFEAAIKQNPDITVIDSTEGGAYIKGSIVMPLKESIEKECTIDFDIKKYTGNCAKLFDDKQRRDIIEYIKDLPKEISKIHKSAKKSAENYDRMLTLAGRENRDNNELSKLFKSNQKLSKEIDDNSAMAYVNYLIQGSIHNVMVGAFDSKEDVKDELTEACILGLSHAKSIEIAAEWILKDIEEKKYFDKLT